MGEYFQTNPSCSTTKVSLIKLNLKISYSCICMTFQIIGNFILKNYLSWLLGISLYKTCLLIISQYQQFKTYKKHDFASTKLTLRFLGESTKLLINFLNYERNERGNDRNYSNSDQNQRHFNRKLTVSKKIVLLSQRQNHVDCNVTIKNFFVKLKLLILGYNA